MKPLRSLLFVPADSERKLAKAPDAGADALILDLEDAVAANRRPVARAMAAEFLAATRSQRQWAGYVRVNPLDSEDLLADLEGVVGPGLDGVVLPKANGAADVIRLGEQIGRLEQRAGLVPGAVRVVVVATETAAGVLNLGSYAQRPARLVGLTWGAEDLAAAVGAISNREADGSLSPLFLSARSGALLAAAAAGVHPIDTLYGDFRDPAGLERDSVQSRRRGFLGRIAIHPDQVAVINRCYMPSAEDVASAREIVAAFAATPGTGVIGIRGRMYDRPHLVQAMKTLAQAGHPVTAAH